MQAAVAVTVHGATSGAVRSKTEYYIYPAD